MSHVIIRKAEVEDYDNILLLLKEFASFQKTPEKLTITSAQMEEDKDFFHCLVAETGEKVIVGFLTYFPAYYSWSGKAVYVDDLYVKPRYRNQGIGRLLLEYVISEAKKSGCKKVRWQVSGWNVSAIRFYKSLGATIDDTERNCNLTL